MTGLKLLPEWESTGYPDSAVRDSGQSQVPEQIK